MIYETETGLFDFTLVSWNILHVTDWLYQLELHMLGIELRGICYNYN